MSKTSWIFHCSKNLVVMVWVVMSYLRHFLKRSLAPGCSLIWSHSGQCKHYLKCAYYANISWHTFLFKQKRICTSWTAGEEINRRSQDRSCLNTKIYQQKSTLICINFEDRIITNMFAWWRLHKIVRIALYCSGTM